MKFYTRSSVGGGGGTSLLTGIYYSSGGQVFADSVGNLYSKNGTAFLNSFGGASFDGVTSEDFSFPSGASIEDDGAGGIDISTANNTTISIADTTGGSFNIFTHSMQLTSTQLSFFGVAVVNRPTGGAATAGGAYTSNEQGMINRMYTALRNLGLIT